MKKKDEEERDRMQRLKFELGYFYLITPEHVSGNTMPVKTLNLSET